MVVVLVVGRAGRRVSGYCLLLSALHLGEGLSQSVFINIVSSSIMPSLVVRVFVFYCY